MEDVMRVGVAIAVFFLLIVLCRTKNNTPYPPKDEKGRPMKANFSSRGTPFRWVRRGD